MIRFVKAAVRGIKNELAAGESGWVNLSGSVPLEYAGVKSTSGKLVTTKTSLESSAVWSCVAKTAQLVSTLPLALYEKKSDGGREKISNDLSDILTRSPNTGQTAVEYWENQVSSLKMGGNSYAEKLFVGKSMVGVRPLFNITPEPDGRGGLKYAVMDRGRKSYLPAEKVFHLRDFVGGNGIGMSAVRYGANSIGAALAADESASGTFSNAMMPSGIVTSEQTLNPEQRNQLGEMMDAYTGSTKAGKVLTLEAGLKWDQLQMNPEDAQLLETRRFSVEDVCRWFGVPPIIVGHSSEGQTMWGSGVEAIMLSWLTLGINPLLRKIEARISKDLVPVEKRDKWFFEFNREAMLQMDSQSKGDFLLKMRMAGIMTGDEGRDKLNLPRRGGNSDELVVQTSMGLVDLMGKDS